MSGLRIFVKFLRFRLEGCNMPPLKPVDKFESGKWMYEASDTVPYFFMYLKPFK